MTAAERNFRRRLVYHLLREMDRVQGVVDRSPDGCAVFQANVHLAATGRDPIAPWRGRYRTERGMWRVFGAQSLRGAMLMVAQNMGWKRIPVSRARVGDLGIVIGSRSLVSVRMLHRNEWIARNETAWSMVRSDRVVMAWSVA